MRNILNKSVTFIITVAIILGMNIISFGSEIAPFITQMPPDIQFDENGVDSDDIIYITVKFKDTSARKVPIEIELTNGATFAVNSQTDIEFATGTNVLPITSYSFVDVDEPSHINILTGNCRAGAFNTIKIPVKAPIMAAKFNVIVRTDSTNPDVNYRERISAPVKVISGLTIDCPDVLNDVDLYDIGGTATYKKVSPPAGSHVFMEIVNADPNEPQFLTLGDNINFNQPVANDRYIYNNVKLPTDHNGVEYEDGDYIIKVYLMDEDYNIISYAEKEVKFVKKPDVLQLSIYAPQLGRYETLNDPEEGQGVEYRGLLVKPYDGYYVPDDAGHGNHNIQSKVTLKKITEAEGLTNAKFVVHTIYGLQEFNAVRTDTSFNANLRPLQVPPDAFTENGIKRVPYVSFEYISSDGKTPVVIYVGLLEPIMDPSGWVYDADTDEPIVGAKVTLYKENDDGSWSRWVDPTGNQINPQLTNNDGKFKWDVEDGNYDVRVFHVDYVGEGLEYSTLNDPNHGVIQVPPERDDIMIRLPKIETEKTFAGLVAEGITNLDETNETDEANETVELSEIVEVEEVVDAEIVETDIDAADTDVIEVEADVDIDDVAKTDLEEKDTEENDANIVDAIEDENIDEDIENLVELVNIDETEDAEILVNESSNV